MVNCTYCDKPIDRNVFCNDSHKVMYHVNGSKKKGSLPIRIVPANNFKSLNPVPKPKRLK